MPRKKKSGLIKTFEKFSKRKYLLVAVGLAIVGAVAAISYAYPSVISCITSCSNTGTANPVTICIDPNTHKSIPCGSSSNNNCPDSSGHYASYCSPVKLPGYSGGTVGGGSTTRPTPLYAGCPTIAYGSRGTCVLKAQRILTAVAQYDKQPKENPNGQNNYTFNGDDGNFGSNTKAAVAAFQQWKKTHGQPYMLVDGIVGTKQTWPSLIGACNYINAHPKKVVLNGKTYSLTCHPGYH